MGGGAGAVETRENGYSEEFNFGRFSRLTVEGLVLRVGCQVACRRKKLALVSSMLGRLLVTLLAMSR